MRTLVLLTAAFALAACASQAQLSPFQSEPQSQLLRAGALNSPAVLLYVSNYNTQTITEYHLTANGNVAPLRTIAGSNTGMAGPENLAVYSSGYIFVTDLSGTIRVFAPTANGNVKPVHVISKATHGGMFVDQITFDKTGNIYVADRQTPAVQVFANNANGDIPALRMITGSHTQLSSPYGVALDSNGKIYVSDVNAKAIFVYPANANGNVAPIARIKGNLTHLGGPSSLAVDSSNNLYVADTVGDDDFKEFAAGANGNATPLRNIHSTNGYPLNALAYYQGTLIAGMTGSSPDYYSVSTFSATASGYVAPIRNIDGNSTGINAATGVAVH